MPIGRSIPGLCMVALMVFSPTIGMTADQSQPCADERSHQFDFWIGEWDVYTGDELAGSNSIRPILDGCVLQESWKGVQGSAGSSFNFFDSRSETWRQFWVWRNGSTLELEGAFADDRMILEGEATTPDGEEVVHRITWYNNPDDSVRQLWEASSDGGRTWETVFDGLYRRH